MRVVLQRVAHASVTVDGEQVGACERGLLLLVAVAPDDTLAQAEWMARKLAGLRIFPDDAGKMNLSVQDVGGSALAISQFTLYGDCRKGRRPSFIRSAGPDVAAPLYDRFCELLQAQGVPTQKGVFAADMQVRLLNDGPVTLVIDTP
jgi:D-tyrosyl-tRNA(Tyr) deacylase